MHIADIIVIVFIGLLAVAGAAEGFAKTVFGVVSTVLAVLVASLFAGELGKMLYGFSFAGPSWGDSIAEGFMSTVKDSGVLNTFPEGGYTEQNVIDMLEALGVPAILGGVIAPSVSEALIGYEGIAVAQIVAEILANFVLTALAFVIICAVIGAVIGILSQFVKDAIEDIELVKNLDSLLGLALGAIKGVLIVWIVLTVCSLFSFIPFMNELVQSTAVVKWFADNNLITLLITSGFDVKGFVDSVMIG